MGLEVLKLVAPRSGRLERGPGGRPEICWEDVAGVLARVPNHIAAYARVKFAEDVAARLKGYLAGEPCPEFQRDLLSVFDAVLTTGGLLDICAGLSVEKYQRMVQLSIYEMLLEGALCPKCQGAGSGFVNESWAVCGFCRGRGRKNFTNAYRAEVIGFCDGSSFARHGKARYLDICQVLIDWEWKLSRVVRV